MTTIRFIEVGVLVEPEPIERPNVRLTNHARCLPKRHELDDEVKARVSTLIEQARSSISGFEGGILSIPIELPEYVRKLGLRRTKNFMRELWAWAKQNCIRPTTKKELAVYQMIFEDLGVQLRTLRKRGFKKQYHGTFI